MLNVELKNDDRPLIQHSPFDIQHCLAVPKPPVGPPMGPVSAVRSLSAAPTESPAKCPPPRRPVPPASAGQGGGRGLRAGPALSATSGSSRGARTSTPPLPASLAVPPGGCSEGS